MRVFQFMLPQEGHPSSKSKLVTTPSHDQEDSSPLHNYPGKTQSPYLNTSLIFPKRSLYPSAYCLASKGGKESYAIKLPIAITAVPDIRLKRAVGLGFKAFPLMTCPRITPIV